MEYLTVTGGNKLSGEITLHGAKNSSLPILAATVLINGVSVIHNVPRLSDVEYTLEILNHLGAKTKREGSTLIIDSTVINNNSIPEKLMKEMRSSIIFMGSLSSRLSESRMFLPGGCEIGLRPIDLHLSAFRALGYNITFDGENICSKFIKRNKNDIVLSYPSVGATENIILASVLLSGKTRIINAAREPEISDLCDFLNKCGAEINGAGSTVIEITGKDKLSATEHTVIPDRILASTIMSAVAITGGEATIKNINLSHLEPVTDVFLQSGCKLWAGDKSLTVKSPQRLRRVKRIETQPYPGFPTDSQATVSAMLCKAKGVSIIKETVFENRFRHIRELEKFGADIQVNSQTAVINGVKSLTAATAYCTDLRGGAAVVVASLAAEGTSVIKDIKHIDRGYEKIECQLSSLGAAVTRKNDEEKRQQKKEQTSEKKRWRQSA